MQTIQINQFKSNLADILDSIQNDGESFIIEDSKKHKRVAMLVPYKEPKEERIFGQLQGTLVIPDDFNEESEQINNLFYNKNNT